MQQRVPASARNRCVVAPNASLKAHQVRRKVFAMSTEAIRRVVKELEGLPEADQHVVLRFLAALRSSRKPTAHEVVRNRSNPALHDKNGLLVFTGKVDAPETDWLQIVRDERDEEVARLATGGGAGR
jgi:hypothetical protein